MIKNYIGAFLIVSIVSYVWWIHYDRNRIQTEFNEYKEAINDQVQKNKAEAIAEKKRQDEKFRDAQIGYNDSVGKLNAALDRLRKSQVVSRSSTLPVASGSSGTMPTSPADTTGIIVPLATYEGTASYGFYADAMMDNLQCSKLINFVKSTKNETDAK